MIHESHPTPPSPAWRIVLLVITVHWLFIGITAGQSGNPTTPAKPTAGAVVTARQPAESVVSRLARIGVRAEFTPQKELLITEGFPFMKTIKAKDVIEIASVEGGIFTAAATSAVPTEMSGMVMMMEGGSFMAQLNAKEGTRTLADCLGNTWIFQKAGLEFDVYPTGSSDPAYNVRSKAAGATIRFTEAGVYLKGFAIKVYPAKVK